ncbi:MAG: hypothetical protein KME37_07750 [Candidatus Thiodiazotropha sp. (ex Codakia orbicularis)]|nr:hypothetical protein [Candidatus Thiodiazotropha sp. (ex Codakia orbicularis)]
MIHQIRNSIVVNDDITESILQNLQIKDSIFGLTEIKGANLQSYTKPKKTQMVSKRFRNGFETVNAANVTFALLLLARNRD